VAYINNYGVQDVIVSAYLLSSVDMGPKA